MTKRATKNHIAQRRVATFASVSVLALVLLTACSGNDYVTGAPAASGDTTVTASSGRGTTSALVHVPAGATAAATGADGYPNINVDTARRLGTQVRSSADQDRLEAELLALGARQKAGADVSAPASVIGELQDLGRRSKRDAEQLIESGVAPAQP